MNGIFVSSSTCHGCRALRQHRIRELAEGEAYLALEVFHPIVFLHLDMPELALPSHRGFVLDTRRAPLPGRGHPSETLRIRRGDFRRAFVLCRRRMTGQSGNLSP